MTAATSPSSSTGVVLAIDANDYLGETPIWSVPEQALYWINVENPPRLSRFDPLTKSRRDWPMPQRLGGVVFTHAGAAIVALARGLYDLDLSTGDLTLRAPSPLPEHVSLHECRCDRQGRLWVGAINHRLRETPELPGGGMLFRLEVDRLVPEVSGLNCANGLAFSPDGTRLYLTDSPKRSVESWRIGTDGRLSDRRLFCTIAPGEGYVDGATVDSGGSYWATLVYGSALRCYDEDGAITAHIRLPFGNPTNVAFGGPDLRTLYITTCKLMPRDGGPLPGSSLLGGVYSMRTVVAGIAEPLFGSG